MEIRQLKRKLREAEERMESYRKALEARVEKLSNERTTLDERTRHGDMEIRQLKRKLREAEERMLGEAELRKKIKLSLKELQDNMVLKITEAEENMELRLMNIVLRIQELNDHLNPPAAAPINDDEV
ncbi:hypothetical protein ACH5RR_002055 [Cinchona calisaya]|uniref:Uncharacterized protein n=1 Tax=Cinchona calisaya TaxID=153742 RepID=A0ABD3B5G5_9GENT